MMNINLKNSNEKLSLDNLYLLTFHGVQNLIVNRKSPFFFSIWLISLILSYSGFCYYMYYNLFEYLKFDKLTKIDVIHEQPTPFPAVTICNREVYNFSIDDILFCEFDFSHECMDNRKEYFENEHDPYFSDCLRFNSGKNFTKQKNSVGLLNSTYGGKKNGLWLDFKLNHLADFSNIYIYIHNQTRPAYSLYNKAIELAPGRVHYLSVDRVFTQRLTEPYNNCLDDVTEFKGRSIFK